MIFNSRKILILIDRKNRCAMEKRPKPIIHPFSQPGDDIDDGKAVYTPYTYIYSTHGDYGRRIRHTLFNCIWFLNLKT